MLYYRTLRDLHCSHLLSGADMLLPMGTLVRPTCNYDEGRDLPMGGLISVKGGACYTLQEALPYRERQLVLSETVRGYM